MKVTAQHDLNTNTPLSMKLNHVIGFLTLILLLACNTPQKAQNTALTPAASSAVSKPVSTPTPTFVTWDKKLVDLGKVKKGEKRSLFFELTNTSGKEIQVDIVDACECTKVDFPRGPIAPNAKGRFDVVFDSTEKDAAETIGITIVFRETDAAGNPIIESVEYKFDLEK